MAQKGIELLENKTLLEKFKTNAADIANRRFSADKIVTEYENYYEEIIGK
jgi:glycosyltransferase involved in cell wall biosynthesis